MDFKNYRASMLLLGLVANAQLLAHELPAFEQSVPIHTSIEAGITEVDLSVTPEATEVISKETANQQTSSNESSYRFGDWHGYNSKLSDTTWIASKDFGIFSLEEYPALEINKETAIMVGTGFHFLNGPVSPDMPPRLFDFQAAFQTRQLIAEGLILDIKTAFGAFSDFEGSARKGVRFPGHVVSYYEWQPRFISVFGVDVLDRDDISLLPVGGFVWRPNENFVCECVFPKPRIQVRLDSDQVIYLGGELGGGTWATERSNFTNDNVTYRDYRVSFGIKNTDSDSVFEIGWAFDRSLEYRSGIGNSQFDDALLLRFRKYY